MIVKFVKVGLTLGIFLLPACGTEVDSGRNVEFERGRNSDEADVFLDPGDETDGSGTTPGTPDPANPDAGSGDGNGNGRTIKLTCFGESPELPGYLTEFCGSVPQAKQQIFKTSYNKICGEKVLVNLFRNSCSWSGTKGMNSYLRVIDRTDLNDTANPEFYFFAAYSSTLPARLDEVIDLLYDQYEDVEEFESNYQFIRNSKHYNTALDRDEGWIEYNTDLATSSTVAKFRARLEVVPITDKLTVTYVWAIGDKALIKDHIYIVFYVDMGDGTTRMVAADEKVILDSGNHSVAYSTVLSVLQQRMEMAYANASKL